MRILITNTDLHQRGGIQAVVRMLARSLERLGHTVMAYGSDLAEGPRLVQNDVVPVTTDPARLPAPPDIIHAQHHLDGMTAVMGLPAVPAIFHCHGATWRGTAFTHPRLYRYLTVSRTLANRLSIELNVDPAHIEVLPNCVELGRFSVVRSLPAAPTRALFYNSRHERDSTTVEAIRTATTRAGLALDCVGFNFGTSTDAPEQLLPLYDVVFASGLSALEALVCGCAVVVLGRSACGPLVRSDNLDALRAVNFSIAANATPVTADGIEHELRRYSAEDAAGVTARLRIEADSERYAQRLVDIYAAVIEQHRATPPRPTAEAIAVSDYLRRLVPLVKMTDELLGRHWSASGRSASVDELSARVALLERRLKSPRA